MDRPPSGGPVDAAPLQVIFSDPLTGATKTSPKIIRLSFTHAIALKELQKSIFFTPRISNYDIFVHGREAEIRIYEPLQDDRTYSVMIRRQLSDYRGATLSTPWTLSFATGPVIDNGSLSGRVFNADLSPAENALIMLYRKAASGTDPDYVVQTDQTGAFRLDHIRTGLYRLIAVHDRNLNLHFDPATEETAIPGSEFVAAGTSSLLMRFAPQKDAKPALFADTEKNRTEETGTIKGSCLADARWLIIEAKALNSSKVWRITAAPTQKGLFRFTFASLPEGDYTISAFIPSGNRKPDAHITWSPGKLDPFTPSDPFGLYPKAVHVRPGWDAETIDFTISAPDR
ncbi:Ig-like domain-containing protein [Chlorobium phaeobacteroides]|uniref:SbsA Ig-like domain-containing protein n=1 Tax=Chlorobium phaeobacteroides (strain DSM 266 / SMG 266 / 2430) TaxID=290317 RepID=A1BIY9_CHLPD|nr:Ig-like domain-containing protein [Chlorobium phaeobacteroides]ABL66366.1 conserved hypothetical protein [Chlorobium phaeobacteroides DSM 266]